MTEAIETYHIHNSKNLNLLNALDEMHLTDINATNGRNVEKHFAHFHNVQLMRLKASSAELLDGLHKK